MRCCQKGSVTSNGHNQVGPGGIEFRVRSAQRDNAGTPFLKVFKDSRQRARMGFMRIRPSSNDRIVALEQRQGAWIMHVLHVFLVLRPLGSDENQGASHGS
jgi:hypothetical protein